LYAYGWGILKDDDKKYILHAGENPTFSSYFIMQLDEQLGVAILANMRSSFTTAIGQGVMDLWEGKNVTSNHTDSYQKLDQIVTIICIVVGCFGTLFMLFTIRILRKLAKKQRNWTSLNGKRLLLFILHTLIVAASLTFMIMIPKILLGGLPWAFIKVWAPTTISLTLYSTLVVGIIYYFLDHCLFLPRKRSCRR
jgi:hypothetical protein